MPNYQLLLEYDGSRYHGWQRLQTTDMTIQGKLETVLSRLFETPVEVNGSGRTDAGVHARGQMASFRTNADLSPETVLAYLRQYLPEDIGVRSVSYAEERFHARLSAVGKSYRYRVWNSVEPCVFDRRFVYVFPEPLDLAAMEAAAKRLLGTHDFRGFSAARTKKSTVRTVKTIEINQSGHELDFTLTGDGFLHHMVRIIVGTLLEIGRGDRSPNCIDDVFSGRVRAEAGFTVPAKGLCLMEVYYP